MDVTNHAPGPSGRIALEDGALAIEVAPEAGGRIARIRHHGQEWLHAGDAGDPLGWGCYPMLPWAGRIRGGQFAFAGKRYRLPANDRAHALHGVGFALPWQIVSRSARAIALSLALPQDQRWPFGGSALQRIELDANTLRLHLSVRAGDQAMPRPSIGWHPWFPKPERLDFAPRAIYPRDADGIATLPLAAPPPGPWDDCFVNHEPVLVRRAGQALRLTSSCRCWVVYDQRAHATCVEPQSGPPDMFNLEPGTLAPGQVVQAWFHLEWR